MLLPLAFALLDEQDNPGPVVLGILITCSAGALLLACCRGARESARSIALREAMLLVVLCWISAAVFGSLPFFFSPHFPSYTDAVFECTSGLTTTGASILADVEVLPRSLQFWRCFTHWIGGIGIVMLMIAILPLVGFGSEQLYRAQFSGAPSEKLQPRIIGTVRSLWKVYFGLTLAQYIALRLAGMNAFDSACHTFSTLGTGGFSTRTASIAAYNSAAIEYVVVFFMVLASINFTQHYRLMVERQPKSFITDPEVSSHLGILALATGAVVVSLVLHNGYSPADAFRRSLFQVTSILTCTGFVTDNYEKWAPFCQLLLLVLMYVGGNTGSTSGGLKTYRILMLSRLVGREFKRRIKRRGVFAIRIGKEVISEKTSHGLLSLVYLAVSFHIVAALTVAASGVDFLTSISTVLSAMSGVGPALGAAGPVEHYGYLPDSAKWILSVTMLAGRLEFFTALVIFSPHFWRR